MSQWGTVDRSDGPDSSWKGKIFRAKSEEAARAAGIILTTITWRWTR